MKFALSMLLICAAWLLLIGQSKRIEVGLPMVVNVPRENKNSYIHALGSIWKCALYCGAFAFLGGVIRSFVAADCSMNYINYASILGGLLSALAICGHMEGQNGSVQHQPRVSGTVSPVGATCLRPAVFRHEGVFLARCCVVHGVQLHVAKHASAVRSGNP